MRLSFYIVFQFFINNVCIKFVGNYNKNIIVKIEMSSNNVFSITISSPSNIIGATVSAVVYTALTTTGEMVALGTGTGIEYTGRILGYGTDVIAGQMMGDAVRTLATTYSEYTMPTIRNTSRMSALGISVLAGATTAFTTNAVIYGTKCIGTYLYNFAKSYERNVLSTIQCPTEVINEVSIVDNDLQNIEIKDTQTYNTETNIKEIK